MLITAATIATTASLLRPLINDIYNGTKKIGLRGLSRWNEANFPRKIAKRLRQLEEVKTIWSPDKAVPVQSFYYPSKLLLNGSATPITRINDIGDRNTIIEGIVGQGKSILLRSLAIEEILSNDTHKLPIFVELRALSKTTTLEKLINRVLEALDIDLDSQTVEYIYKSGKFALLLDGYDEIEEEVEKAAYFDIEHLSQKYPELLIIVTSRPNHSIQRSSEFRTLKIANLTPQDHIPFMGKLGIPTAQATIIRDAIKKSPSDLPSLITTPLMLTLVVIVYQSENEIPETLPDFFERLFHVVFTRHDRLKATFQRKHHSGLSERRLQALFEAFCFMALQQGYGRSLNSEQFKSAFDDAVEYSENCNCETEKFKHDITKACCLMLEEGIDTTTFLHKSILEYYSAAFIKHSSDEVAKLFYEQVIEDSRRWWEVLGFLKNIDSFRYSTYFAIPEIEFTKNLLKKFLHQDTIEAQTEFIQALHPNLEVELQNFDHKTLDLAARSFGPFKAETKLSLKGLDERIMSAIEETLPSNITSTNIFDLFDLVERLDADDSKVFSIKVTTLIRCFGAKHFVSAIEAHLRLLEAQEFIATKTIENQERRKLIFKKKTGSEVISNGFKH